MRPQERRLIVVDPGRLRRVLGVVGYAGDLSGPLGPLPAHADLASGGGDATLGTAFAIPPPR
jgi:hypothetical protein